MRGISGGGRGIRTPGTVSRTAVFKTACFNHSHIPPQHGGACLGWPSCGSITVRLSITSVARCPAGRECRESWPHLSGRRGMRMATGPGPRGSWAGCSWFQESTRRTAPAFSSGLRANARVLWRVPWLRRGRFRTTVHRRSRGAVGARFPNTYALPMA